LVFTTELKSVYCAVRTEPLNKAVCASSSKGKQPLSCAWSWLGRVTAWEHQVVLAFAGTATDSRPAFPKPGDHAQREGEEGCTTEL